MDKNSQVFQKIKKCMALSKSGNEHEAAAALRQAQKLMQLHGLNHDDLLASEVLKARAKSGAIRRPAAWESYLVGHCADAFGCYTLYYAGSGYWEFLGRGSAPEIARYVFTVLFRQAKKARKAFISQLPHRCSTATRRRRGDIFCTGWVRAVGDKITEFCGSDEDKAALDAHMLSLGTLGETQLTQRLPEGSMSDQEWASYLQGKAKGEEAELHRGVHGTAAEKLGYDQLRLAQ
jgi:hypothetical protein